MDLREPLDRAALQELAHAGLQLEERDAEQEERETVRQEEREAAVPVHEDGEPNHVPQAYRGADGRENELQPE